jgi:hypothetical protein
MTLMTLSRLGATRRDSARLAAFNAMSAWADSIGECNVTFDELEVISSTKGSWYASEATVEGAA